MPRIPTDVLKCTFFLYKSREDAERGVNTGGTGFFLGVRSSVHEGVRHAFAVTNWHVAVSRGFSVIRVNTLGGGVDIIEREPHEWLFKPGWYDLAVSDAPSIDKNEHDVRVLDWDSNGITEAHVKAFDIGPGEDVFMVGRFIDHDGVEVNAPATRFGNISMMPGAPILQRNGAKLPSYCVDMHSRTGFSGSPVFSYRTAGADLVLPREFARLGPGSHYMGLLGVLWGQFPEHWEITADGSIIQTASIMQPDGYIVPGRYVNGVSGMSCVCPAWAIRELLDLDDVKEIMDADDREIARSKEDSRLVPDPQS